ncbi:hypothetical protein CYLTODRAFT_43484 [Cylindrobasidium torrendii FP15055 ss-10]|uniref:Uncharacterized protein n=1 Tax=Cylindrobasidium torrendii FP15055 ss-10 TaxID=1314674 RepID=A0A0D7B6F1_9AGAR|nr:hypothetical protein CYLTODRAFT_43484 [Cylindrobasidium torrendii FP15055 ss-10]
MKRPLGTTSDHPSVTQPLIFEPLRAGYNCFFHPLTHYNQRIFRLQSQAFSPFLRTDTPLSYCDCERVLDEREDSSHQTHTHESLLCLYYQTPTTMNATYSAFFSSGLLAPPRLDMSSLPITPSSPSPSPSLADDQNAAAVYANPSLSASSTSITSNASASSNSTMGLCKDTVYKDIPPTPRAVRRRRSSLSLNPSVAALKSPSSRSRSGSLNAAPAPTYTSVFSNAGNKGNRSRAGSVGNVLRPGHVRRLTGKGLRGAPPMPAPSAPLPDVPEKYKQNVQKRTPLMEMDVDTKEN